MVIKSDKNMAPFTDHTLYNHNAPWRQAMPQILAVCVKNILLLGFGMTLGFPTILIPSLSGDNPNETFRLGQEAISWIGSLNLICVPIGCLISGAVTQPLGRRRAMQFVNIPFIISWLLFHFSTEVWQVFLALAIHGVTGGLLEAPVNTYVAEITQPNLRGILASVSTVSVIFGILAQFFLGTFLHWKTVALFSIIVPIISIILLFFIPESPYWLISKYKFEEAREALAWLRGWTEIKEIEPEFDMLCRQIIKLERIIKVDPNTQAKNGDGKVPIEYTEVMQKPANMFDYRLYCKKNFIWPYTLIAFTFFLLHFSGMAPLQTYAITIFATMESPVNKYYATILLGVAEVFGCIISSCLIYQLGKRKMNFFSLAGTGFCFLIAATYAYLTNITQLEIISDTDPESAVNATLRHELSENSFLEKYSWLPTACLISAAFFVHCGIRILPWALTGEVYCPEIRSNAAGLSGFTTYVISFGANKVFLNMVASLTIAGTFWFYSSVSFFGLVVLYFILPETEGKSLFDITEHFAGNLKLDNKVYKGQKSITDDVDNVGFKKGDVESRF